MAQQEDVKLVNRIRSGDRQAEKELLARFGERITRKVYYFLREKREDTRDVIQDTIVEVLKSLRAGKYDPGTGTPLGSYISGITKNVIQKYFREQKVRYKIRNNKAEPVNSGNPGNPEAIFIDEEMRERVREILGELQKKYQEVLYLTYYEGLSVKEISQKLNLPPRRVSERLNYARKLVLKKIKK